MHIAFVTTESPYGDARACGIAAYLRAIIPALVESGHRVSVFANAPDERDFAVADGRVLVHHFRLPSLHWYASRLPVVRAVAPLPLRQFEWSREFYRRVARVAAETKIDVIESSETGALFLNRVAPVVIRLHGSELTFRKYSGAPLNLSVKWNDALESRSCRLAAAVTTPSDFQANEIVTRRGWPRERVHVIPNPISETMLRAARDFHRNGDAERFVLYTGRLAPVKGVETLLAAAKLVQQKDPSVRFVLAGPWQMPRTPEAYGLKDDHSSVPAIRWVGPQDEAALIELYKRASLFVMPSYYESFGISVVEASAFGLPVVATQTSGLAEILKRNDAASLVAAGNPSKLADAIIARMSTQTKERPRFIEAFEADQVATETLKVYEQVIARK